MAAEKTICRHIYLGKNQKPGWEEWQLVHSTHILYHYYDEINAYGHPTEEMIAKAEDNNTGKGNKIFPVTGKSRKNIDKMFLVSEKDDKMFPDSDRGKEKWLKSAVGSLD